MCHKVDRSARMVQWGIFSLILMFSTACSEKNEVKFPPNSKAGIVIGEGGQITLYDSHGSPAVSARKCTKDMEAKYGDFCADGPRDENIRKVLISTGESTGESVLKSALGAQGTKNQLPKCIRIVIGGDVFEVPIPCSP